MGINGRQYAAIIGPAAKSINQGGCEERRRKGEVKKKGKEGGWPCMVKHMNQQNALNAMLIAE